jgi:hypothetical protein
MDQPDAENVRISGQFQLTPAILEDYPNLNTRSTVDPQVSILDPLLLPGFSLDPFPVYLFFLFLLLLLLLLLARVPGAQTAGGAARGGAAGALRASLGRLPRRCRCRMAEPGASLRSPAASWLRESLRRGGAAGRGGAVAVGRRRGAAAGGQGCDCARARASGRGGRPRSERVAAAAPAAATADAGAASDAGKLHAGRGRAWPAVCSCTRTGA